MPKYEKIALKRPLKSTIGNENSRKISRERKDKIEMTSNTSWYGPLIITYSP
jgi:hypothetical protein